MPELKGEPICLRQKLRKCPQQIEIRLQIRRRLDQDRPQLARLPHWLHALQKKSERIVTILQLFKMRDRLMNLGGKLKVRGRRPHPAGYGAGGWHAAKRRIQLHGIQPRRIELKKSFRRQLLREKRRFPTR